MIKKVNCILALVLAVLTLGACGKKEETQSKTETATPAVETPKIVYGEMVLIPAGEYIIGTNERDLENKKEFSNAYPEHKVKLPAFWIDKYEVTGKQYLDFTVDTSYVAEGQEEGKTWRTFFSYERAYNPVTYITFKDAEAYCKGVGKRMPTEEEWEAAGRGPNGYRFPWGNEFVPLKANTMDAGFVKPVDVGRFEGDVSPFGVHDMFGNVQEWTSSIFKSYPGNPKAASPEFAGYRVLRGLGSRHTNVKSAGLWSRSAWPGNYLADFGCRCAKNATPEEAAKAAPAK
jgi:formylglycine-generating enzyme required for sulfatase activity